MSTFLIMLFIYTGFGIVEVVSISLFNSSSPTKQTWSILA